jgi:hypothetical protein
VDLPSSLFVVGEEHDVAQEVQVPGQRARANLELPPEVAPVGQVSLFAALADHVHDALDPVILGAGSTAEDQELGAVEWPVDQHPQNRE